MLHCVVESIFVYFLNKSLCAVNNYYRAFEQRSRWLREDLILIGDIDEYEKKLIEEWTVHFETMNEELGSEATEKAKITAARAVYDWAEKVANFPIRERCQELFITRGSYQMLSDKLKVGWHPDFKRKLSKIMGVDEVLK